MSNWVQYSNREDRYYKSGVAEYCNQLVPVPRGRRIQLPVFLCDMCGEAITPHVKDPDITAMACPTCGRGKLEMIGWAAFVRKGDRLVFVEELTEGVCERAGFSL